MVLRAVCAGPVEMSCVDVAKTRLRTGELLLICNLQLITCAAYREWRS
jgi:hypothetical protein